jgi:hypothetical protein
MTQDHAIEKILQLENGTLPKSEWTHEMHLTAGLYYYIYEQKNAFKAMSRAIYRYNAAVGTSNENSGYHATLTMFWVWMIRQFCIKNNVQSFDNQSIELLLQDTSFKNRGVIEQYYHPADLFSPYARKHVSPPEYQEMEGMDWFVQ